MDGIKIHEDEHGREKRVADRSQNSARVNFSLRRESKEECEKNS